MRDKLTVLIPILAALCCYWGLSHAPVAYPVASVACVTDTECGLDVSETEYHATVAREAAARGEQ